MRTLIAALALVVMIPAAMADNDGDNIGSDDSERTTTGTQCIVVQGTTETCQ